jgi:hypothetical protein
VEALQQMQPQIGQQLQSFVQFYWGGIGFTAGPPYIGIVVCFFAFIGLFAKNNPHRWWIPVAIIFSLMLAAGSYFQSFNYFMVDHLPFYNKFRAPSMILVVPTLLLGILSLYGLQTVIAFDNFKNLLKKFKPSFILLVILFVSVILFYFTSDFKSEADSNMLNQISLIQDPNQRAIFDGPAHALVNGLQKDRQTLIETDLTRAIIYIGCVFLLLFIYYKKMVNQTLFILGIGVIAMMDLFNVNTKYLKSETYIESSENENTFIESQIDIALKKDKSFYRVLDMRAGIENAFNGGAIVAYHHKTVGGYNPAKLSIYQDLIENQWYKFPNCMPVVNMMNTKYVITGNITTDTIANPQALGNVWFIKGIEYKKGPSEVMSSLSFFNPRDTAIFEEKDKNAELSGITFDSSATIQLINNKNDEINYISNSSQKQLAVFSEVYYKLGWKAYIDNVETPIYKTNYVLRSLVVPAGKHDIRFEFKPTSINAAQKASIFASTFLWLVALIGAFQLIRKKIKQVS